VRTATDRQAENREKANVPVAEKMHAISAPMRGAVAQKKIPLIPGRGAVRAAPTGRFDFSFVNVPSARVMSGKNPTSLRATRLRPGVLTRQFRRRCVIFGRVLKVFAGAALLAGGTAIAAKAELLGAPVPRQMGFLPANSPIQEGIEWFHNDILVPMTVAISLFVLALLAWCIYRFNEKANPVPSRTTHNGPLEIAWTIAPALILVVMAVPSFRLLAEQLIIPAPDLTVKVTASQWHWNYTYPKDVGGFSFNSLIKEDQDLKPGDIRLLSVDNAIYMPVGKVVEFDVVSQDVIHSFSVPSFGIKIDAVPGRLNKTWAKADKVGVFYGQCSNICGINHGYMPIEVHVVSEDDYAKWLDGAKKQFASADAPGAGVDLAQAERIEP
jgi:cytochrome c oxidase subunit II